MPLPSFFPWGTGRAFFIRQQSSGRFMDAYPSGVNDFAVVTRPELPAAEQDGSQMWHVLLIGGVYTIQHQIHGRFVDAHPPHVNDSAVVTRPRQENDTQSWVFIDLGNDTYTIQQLSNSRFMDAYPSGDFALVTRPDQNNATQRWVVTEVPFPPPPPRTYIISQQSNGQPVGVNPIADFALVTRPPPAGGDRWILSPIGAVCTLRQVSSGRFMEAYPSGENDSAVVTRPEQGDATQRWILTPLGNEIYTIQQLSSGRFMDAYPSGENDFAVVTRGRQENDTQRWGFRITPLTP